MRAYLRWLVLLLWGVATTVLAEDTARDEALRALTGPEAAARRAAAVQLAGLGRMSDVNALVKALQDRDEETRALAEEAIWEIWGRSGDPAIDELYAKGVALMSRGAVRQALEVFDLIIAQKPSFAEGWNKRATLYYTLGEYKKSLADCDEVIKRNPLHFGALSGYGLIYVQLNQPARAIEYFKRALKINPNLRGVEESINVLERQGKRGRGSYI